MGESKLAHQRPQWPLYTLVVWVLYPKRNQRTIAHAILKTLDLDVETAGTNGGTDRLIRIGAGRMTEDDETGARTMSGEGREVKRETHSMREEAEMRIVETVDVTKSANDDGAPITVRTGVHRLLTCTQLGTMVRMG